MKTNNTTTPGTDIHPRFDSGAAALWASFFVVLALVITQATRLGAGNAAYAGDVANVGQITALTTKGGPNDDVLILLDKREDTIMVYGVQGQRSVELLQVESLTTLFNQGRSAASSGGTRR